MELLAPAGDYAAVLAAVNNGADAVYLGGKRFHARQKEVSFSEENLKKSLEYAHKHGRKVYVTLNILLDSAEVEQALDDAYDLYRMGVDALIVQDVGLLQMLHQALPQMRVHASTQATIYHADGLRLMQKMGVKRTVLAREVSLDEIKQMHTQVPDMELEVFVHGALCYSYSGQCLFSSLVGGRSGNRGRCSQPCRKPYRLLSTSHPEGMSLPPHSRFLLSTADQCLLGQLSTLEKAGVTSLKIEGRLKKTEYVALITRYYRQVLDKLPEEYPHSTLAMMEKEMQGMFNRGFTHDYLDGKRKVLRVDRPDNRGVVMGQVIANGDTVQVRLSEPVQQNDGIQLKGIHGEEITFALRQPEVNGKKVSQAAAGEILSLHLREKVLLGEKVYKTRDTRLIEKVQASLHEQKVNKAQKIPLTMKLRAIPGELLYLQAEDGNGCKVETYSQIPVTVAENHPVELEKVHEKLARLGNTPFMLKAVQADLDARAMFPFSELNQMRRQLVERLEEKNQKLPVAEDSFLQQKNQFYEKLYHASRWETALPQTLLSVRVGNPAAAEAAILAGARRVILDIEPFTPVHYQPEQARRFMQLAQEREVYAYLALPRICRGQERTQQLPKWVRAYPKAGYLLSTWGDIVWAKKNQLRFALDYSCNITNEVSYRKACQMGAESVCLSVELHQGQIGEFCDLSRAEILVQGEVTLMVSEGCIFHNLLPSRPDGKCPHYCAQEHYALLDEKNYPFPLAHDAHCRQYVFNSRTLCLWEELPEIIAWKPAALRLELQRAEAGQVQNIVSVYKDFLAHPAEMLKKTEDVKEILRENSFSAFTRGHYLRGVE